MRWLMSVYPANKAVNISLLLLRIGFGVLLMQHGFTKLIRFHENKEHFMNFMGLGPRFSLMLTIFAEFFCSFFLILGFMTRILAIPLIINMGVAVFVISHGDIFDEGERATLFLIAYVAIFFLGPGKYSIDGWLSSFLFKPQIAAEH
jgi:putative oxidoreductase